MKGFGSIVAPAARISAALIALALAGAAGCKKDHEYVELPSVATAPAYTDAEGFVVRGHAVVDRVVDHSWEQTLNTNRGAPSGTATRHTYLVPVVGEEWTAGKPVPMWLTCPSEKACLHGPEAWLALVRSEFDRQPADVEVADRVGREITFSRPSSQWLDAVRRANAQGLISAHGAPIVRWPVD
ncbi:MAG: hypothetical protein ACOC1F_04980 [Myxococcota bacterium]